MKPIKWDKTKEKEKVYNTVSELYRKRLENCYDKYNKLSRVKKISTKKISSLKLKTWRLQLWQIVYREELDDEEKLDNMPPLDGDEEEVREGKGIKF